MTLTDYWLDPGWLGAHTIELPDVEGGDVTLHSISSDQAARLFGVVRDTTFDWTVAEVPQLMHSLGWTLTEVIPGTGAIAETGWGVPNTDAELCYENGIVQSITIYVTNHASDERADRFAVLDVFAALCAIATAVLGQATKTIPGHVPRVQWRLAAATATIQNTGRRVIITWWHNEFQDFNDSIGRY